MCRRLPPSRRLKDQRRSARHPTSAGWRDLEKIIHRCRNELSEEDQNDPNFAADSDLWPALLTEECLAALVAFEGPMRHALYNRAGRHAWWNGQRL
jgi:hypothetical protein